MPDTSIRERIMAAIEARLSAIATPTYNFSLSGKVFQWRSSDFSEAELPGVSLIDPEQISENLNTMGTQEHRLKVEIRVVNMATGADGSTKTTKLNAQQIRKLDDDLVRAIGTDPKWTVDGTRLALDTLPGKSEIEVDQQTKIAAGLLRTITVIYRTPRFEPGQTRY